MNDIRVLNNIVSVKNASVVYDNRDQTYHLIHYDTEIATIKKDNTIIKLLECSNSSTRAIYQLTDFLNIDRLQVRSKLEPFKNFVKYNMSTQTRLKKNDYIDVFNGKRKQQPIETKNETWGEYTFKVQKYLLDPRKCLHCIFDPSHYYQDGSCHCYDKDDKNMKKWGYKWNDKKGCWV
jgi:hypothetical protein